MQALVWVNGHLFPSNSPVISALDHGFTLGDGVFETIAVRQGRPLALQRHLARLKYSLARVSLPPVAESDIRHGITTILASAPTAGRLRLSVSAGLGPAGLSRGAGNPTVAIAAGPAVTPQQCRMIRSPWPKNERSPLAGVKSTSAGDAAAIYSFALTRGADEALQLNTQGHLCEGLTTNVFVETESEILTPPLASGCLPGIARGLALEWGVQAGLPIRVAAVGELGTEVFAGLRNGTISLAVSSVLRQVQLVAEIDGRPVHPGSLLSKLREVYAANIARYPDPDLPRARRN